MAMTGILVTLWVPATVYAGNRDFSVSISPPVSAGGAAGTYSVTVGNVSDQGNVKIDQVVVTLGPGFTLSGAPLAPGWTASTSGTSATFTASTPAVRVGPGESFAFVLTAVAACGVGTYPFNVQAYDNNNVLYLLQGSVPQVTVNTPCNQAPTAAGDSYSTTEETALTVAAPGVLGNDSDPEGNSLSAALLSGPLHGALTLNSNGSFVYTPAPDYSGTDSFTYQAGDGTSTSAAATVNLNISPVNDPPSASADSYSTAEDTALTVPAPGLLGNDSDVDGPALSAVLDAGPSHGSLTLNGDGSLSYTPNPNYNGPDSFTYSASDGTATSSPATVSLTVTAVNDAPVANSDSYSTPENTPLTIAAPGVLANDSDVEGSALTAALGSGPSHGSVTFNAGGSFSYTPTSGYSGPDSFTYTVSDGSLTSAAATVNISISAVNDAPSAVADSYTTAEDTPLTVAAPGLLSNDSDPDGDPLSAALVTGPAHGSLTLNADGSFAYSPALNYDGADSFTYKVSDGSLDSASVTVALTVTPVGDAPSAVGEAFSLLEEGPLTIPAPGLLANDSDVEGFALTSALVGTPSHGSVVVNADGSFTYLPDANYHGPDSFTYQVSDGSLTSGSATVALTIIPVNDAPVGSADAYSVAEDALLTVAAPGVLSNDSDVDGDPLSALLVSGAAHGTLSLSAGGSFDYLPALNYNGSDSFSYQAYDGSAMSAVTIVTITVTPVNDADVEGTALTAVLGGGAAHGTVAVGGDGSFTYTPDANYHGPDSFTYSVSDGSLSSGVATVTLTVAPVNDGPVATPNTYSVAEDSILTEPAVTGVLANDTDGDGDPLIAVLVSGPTNGVLSLNADGSFVYVPAADYNGPDSFTYKATDGTLQSGSVTVSLTVTPVNDAPSAGSDSYSTNGALPLNVAAPGLLANDTDEEGDLLTAVLVSGPAHGTLTLNADGSFTFVPDSGYSGSDSFTYSASDGSASSAPATVNLSVNMTNLVPVATGDTYSVAEDGVLTVPAPGVLGNDTDDNGDPLSALLENGPEFGSLTLNTDGSFTYTPNPDFTGSDMFSYKASDGALESGAVKVSITVEGVPDAPVAVSDSHSLAEEGTLTVAAPGVLANDTDADGDSLTAALVSSVSHGSVTLNADGSFTYTPAADYSGTDSFTYSVSDGALESEPATVFLTISGVNDAPVAVADAYTATEDSALTIPAGAGLLANDTDADGDSLTALLVSGVSHGSLTLNADGSFAYTPAANYSGPDSFSYKAADGSLESGAVTVSLTVSAINDAPIAAPDSYSLSQNGNLVVPAATGVLANDTDAEGSPLFAVLVSGPTSGSLTLNANGSFTYTPAAGFSGSDSFTYQAGDGSGTSATTSVSLNVAFVPAPPATVLDFAVSLGVSSTNNPATSQPSLALTGGGTAFYFYSFTNTGNQTLTIAQATDSVAGSIAFSANIVPPGATVTGTRVKLFGTPASLESETATLSVQASFAGSPLAPKTASVTVTNAPAPITSGSVTVRVLDNSERNGGTPAPVPGATVTLSGGATGTTNASGQAVFANLALGTYTVTAQSADPLNFASGDVQSGTASVTLDAAGADRSVNLLLAWEAPLAEPTAPASGTLDVRVLDNSPRYQGQPVPLSHFRVWLGGLSLITDAHGKVQFTDLPAGTYMPWAVGSDPQNTSPLSVQQASATATLTADKMNASVTIQFSWEAPLAAPGTPAPGSPGTGTGGTGGVVVAGPAATAVISGRVCAPQQPGAEISAMGPGGAKAEATVASDGILGVWRNYVLSNLLPGSWTVTLTTPGQAAAHQTVTVAEGAQVAAADFTLACTGQPAEGGTMPNPWWFAGIGILLLAAGMGLRLPRKARA